jgi:hypothetical protein
MSNPNYAPNPKNQQVYRNLQNKKLSDVTAKDIQQLTDPTFIQATNQDALITYNMLNLATMRNGLPIPKTSFNTQVEITASGEPNGKDVFNPNQGEVWSLQGMSFEENISGNAVVYVGLKDTNGLIVYFSIDTTGGSPWSPDNEFNKMVYVDENMMLFVYVFGTFSSNRVLCNFNLIRVR